MVDHVSNDGGEAAQGGAHVMTVIIQESGNLPRHAPRGALKRGPSQRRFSSLWRELTKFMPGSPE